ncbi:hypothetical protein F4604DRAFT_1905289 [Suillus subluteus]|nr:hypothetical protein F4604DRAFT_1905289 [Suillus subluteus]
MRGNTFEKTVRFEMNLCNVCVSLKTPQYDSESLLTASVPPACTRSRGTLLAAEFQNLYGLKVATALRTPPVISAPPLDPAAVQASKAMSLQWISASVDDPARRLEKLKRTDIQTSLIEKCVMHSLIIPGDVYYTYFMLEQVFWEIVSRSVKDMSARLECKQNALAEPTRRKLSVIPKAKELGELASLRNPPQMPAEEEIAPVKGSHSLPAEEFAPVRRTSQRISRESPYAMAILFWNKGNKIIYDRAYWRVTVTTNKDEVSSLNAGNSAFLHASLLLGASMIEERFSPKKKASNGAMRGITDWTLKDMLDPRGLHQSGIELYGIEDVPVMVPNVRDAAGVLIYPSKYSQKITAPVPVVCKGSRVHLPDYSWTLGPDGKRPNGSRVYQTRLRSMRLLPTTGAARCLFNKPATKITDAKGKRKADGPAGQTSPAKRGSGQSKAA